jgi:HSP20 family molecular chaperone IbpA
LEFTLVDIAVMSESSDSNSAEKMTGQSEQYLVETRCTNHEFVVVADVLGANEQDLSAGIDSNTNELVIKVSETVLKRVTIPWRSVAATKAWFRNGVFTVRLQSHEIDSRG